MSSLASSATIHNSDTQVIIADVEVEGLTVDEAMECCFRIITTLDPAYFYGFEVIQMGDDEEDSFHLQNR